MYFPPPTETASEHPGLEFKPHKTPKAKVEEGPALVDGKCMIFVFL